MEGTMAEIRGFGGNFAPRNWAFCSGQLVSIAQNSALFSLLGTTYGGDGRTTFALPDLRGRVPIGTGTGPGLTSRSLGQRSGTEDNYMNMTQLAAHTHTVTAGNLPVKGTATAIMHVNNSSGALSSPEDSFLGVETGAIGLYEPTSDGSTLNANAISVSTAGMGVVTSNLHLSNAGASSAMNNMQPFLTLNWIICLYGIYPSRN